jgi:5,10-methylenetetrahydromethanopterin reductase
LREYIGLLRALWAGRFVAPYGRSFRLACASGRPIPVYLSASGPNMLQLAGELADGVILMVGLSREALEYALTNIEIGAKRAGRRLDDLDIAAGALVHVADDWRRVKKLVQPYAANFAIRHRDALRDAGVPVPEARDESGIYPDLIHAEDWERAIEVTNWVPDEVVEAFAEKFCLMGTAEEIAARIGSLASYGVKNLFVRGIATYELPTELCEALSSRVLPRFRADSLASEPRP